MGLFSTSNGFHRQERAGSLSLAEEVSKSQGVEVRILAPFDDEIRQIEQNLKKERRFEIRDIEEGSRTRVSILIVDRGFSLVVSSMTTGRKVLWRLSAQQHIPTERQWLTHMLRFLRAVETE